MIGPGWDAVPPLNVRDLPSWEAARGVLAERIVPALPEAGFLLFLNVILFLAAHFALLRADVRAL